MDGTSGYSSFIMYSSASRNMAYIKEHFLTLHPHSGPSIFMGDESEIPAKQTGRINLDNGYLNNVLFVSDIATNLLSEMNYKGSAKRVKFTQ